MTLAPWVIQAHPHLRGLNFIPSAEFLLPLRGPSTGCGDRDMDVLGATVQPPTPAEPRRSVRALSGDHVTDTPGPCLQLLCSSCSEGVALSHARLFSLSMPFLLEKSWVIRAPTREAGCRILWGPPPTPDSATAALPGARPALCSRIRGCCRVLSDARTWMLARLLPGRLKEAQWPGLGEEESASREAARPCFSKNPDSLSQAAPGIQERGCQLRRRGGSLVLPLQPLTQDCSPLLGGRMGEAPGQVAHCPPRRPFQTFWGRASQAPLLRWVEWVCN